MRARRVPLLGVAMLSLVILTTGTASAQVARGQDENAIANALVQLINAERQARSLAPLARVSDAYAQQRAEEQPDGGNDGHAAFDSEAAAAAMGLGTTRTGGEALFYGSLHTAGDAVLGWMASASHRDLLMSDKMRVIAVGVSCSGRAMHAVAHAGAPTTATVTPSAPRPVVTTAGSGPSCDPGAATGPADDPTAPPPGGDLPGASTDPPPVTSLVDPPGPNVGLPSTPRRDDAGGGSALLKTVLVLLLAAVLGWFVWNRTLRALGSTSRPGGTPDGDEPLNDDGPPDSADRPLDADDG